MHETAIDRLFLDFSSSKLRELVSRIDACLAKLNEDQVWTRGGANENAIGNLVLHLCGNVRQWIVSGVGGAPDSRQRDAEFLAHGGLSVAQLRERVNATVAEALPVLDRVTPQRLSDRMTIQGYEGSALDAIYHVVEHFAMHTGQIIFATKMLTGDDLGFYRNLSAPGAHVHPAR